MESHHNFSVLRQMFHEAEFGGAFFSAEAGSFHFRGGRRSCLWSRSFHSCGRRFGGFGFFLFLACTQAENHGGNH